jgi:hypothetical protein
MTSFASRAYQKFMEDGPIEFIAVAFKVSYRRYIRPILPSLKYIYYNDVVVGEQKLLDPIVPFRPHPGPNLPKYEEPLVNAIEAFVLEGDTVVEIGGGWGVGTVTAARNAGNTGFVHCYEATKFNVDCVRETVEFNGMTERVALHHGIVGPGISLVGNRGDPMDVSPTDIPECDVLVLDCEGAELAILTEMTVHPRVVIVETHGHRGSPTAEVREIAEENGYQFVRGTPASSVEETDHPIDIGTKRDAEKRDNYMLIFELDR